MLVRIQRAVAAIRNNNLAQKTREQEVLDWARELCGAERLRVVAEQIGVDAGKLTRVISGERRISDKMMRKLKLSKSEG